jgi:hypothetical protein
MFLESLHTFGRQTSGFVSTSFTNCSNVMTQL